MKKKAHERRIQKRIPFITEVQGTGMHRSCDLSIGGMYIEAVNSFPVGSLLDLKFKLSSTDERPVQVKARVLYRHEGVGMGLGFVNISPEDRERIKRLVEHEQGPA